VRLRALVRELVLGADAGAVWGRDRQRHRNGGYDGPHCAWEKERRQSVGAMRSWGNLAAARGRVARRPYVVAADRRRGAPAGDVAPRADGAPPSPPAWIRPFAASQTALAEPSPRWKELSAPMAMFAARWW